MKIATTDSKYRDLKNVLIPNADGVLDEMPDAVTPDYLEIYTPPSPDCPVIDDPTPIAAHMLPFYIAYFSQNGNGHFPTAFEYVTAQARRYVDQKQEIPETLLRRVIALLKSYSAVQQANITNTLYKQLGFTKGGFNEIVKAVEEELDEDEVPAADYDIRKGWLCRYGDRLLNADIVIFRQVTQDDGEDRKIVYYLRGESARGERLPEVELDAGDFRKLDWLDKLFGVAVNPVPAKEKYIPAAIKYISNQRGVDRTMEYIHTGWRKIKGTRCFLSQDNVLAPAGANIPGTVDLEEEKLKLYSIPAPAEDAYVSYLGSLRYLDITPEKPIALPIWLILHGAPLTDICYPGVVFGLEGATSSGKTGMATLALNHCGARFGLQNIPGDWLGTWMSMERQAFLIKNLPMLWDDLAGGGTPEEQRDQLKMAHILLRNWANRSSRSRSSTSGRNRATYPIRGLAMFTAEEAPGGKQSVMNRTFLIHMKKGDVRFGEAAFQQALQDKSLYLSHYAHYLRWLMTEYDRIADTMPARVEQLRVEAARSFRTARLANGVSYLFAVYEEMTRYSETLEIPFPVARDDVWNMLLAIGERMEEKTQQEDPVTLFIKIIRNGILSRRARAETINNYVPADHNDVQFPHDARVDAPIVAYYDATHIYINGDEALTFAQKEMNAVRGVFPLHSITALYEHLEIAELIDKTACNAKRNTRRIRVSTGLARCAPILRPNIFIADEKGEAA